MNSSKALNLILYIKKLQAEFKFNKLLKSNLTKMLKDYSDAEFLKLKIVIKKSLKTKRLTDTRLMSIISQIKLLRKIEVKESNLKKLKKHLLECQLPILFDSSFKDRIKMDYWVLPNKKNFPLEFKNFEKNTISQKRKSLKIWDNKSKKYIDIVPFRHQKIVSDYLNENSPNRGLLLYHGLGSGKSGASIMAAEGYTNRRIVVMLPKSLKNNYEMEIKTFGDIAYKKHNYWCFIKLDLLDNDIHNKKLFQLLAKYLNIPVNLVNKIITYKKSKKLAGIWMINIREMKKGTEPNYNNLDIEDQKEINKQIEILYEYKYIFIHYNGGASVLKQILKGLLNDYESIASTAIGKTNGRFTKSDNNKLLEYIYNPDNKIENPFDNKVLVVDEIHNLISLMIGNGFNGPMIYELIMRAKNIKLIFLSGTPVINYAYELALMYNLLRGYINTLIIKIENIKNPKLWSKLNLSEILKNNKYIDRFKIDSVTKLVEIIAVPDGFKYNDDGNGLIKDNEFKYSDDAFIELINIDLNNADYRINGNIKKNKYTMFSDILYNNHKLNKKHTKFSILLQNKMRQESQELFNNLYIDSKLLKVKDNTKMDFKTRIIGLTSFFNEKSGIDEETGSELFPKKIQAHDVETTVFMSDYQFKIYTQMREEERKLEKMQSKKKKKPDDFLSKSASYFRVLSRQSGIFVFPPNIIRPRHPNQYKSKKKQQDIMLDEVKSNGKEEFSSEIINSEIIKTKILKLILKICENKMDDSLINLLINNLQLDENYKYTFKELLNELGVNSSNIIGENIKQIIINLCKLDLQKLLLSFEDKDELSNEVSYQEACIGAINKLHENNLTSIENILIDNLKELYLPIINNINNSKKKLYCYSNKSSNDLYYLLYFCRILNENGYTEYKLNNENDVNIHVGNKVRVNIKDDIWETATVKNIMSDDKYLLILNDNSELIKTKYEINKCYFILFSGVAISEKYRDDILNFYSADTNKNGEKCFILLTRNISNNLSINVKNLESIKSDINFQTIDSIFNFTLSDLSPKYNLMLNNINKSPGLVFCYSQFRNVEGIEIFSRVLNNNGYSKLSIDENGKLIEPDKTLNIGTKVRIEFQENIWKTGIIKNIIKDKYIIIVNINIEKIEIIKTKDEIYKCFYTLWTGSENPTQRAKALDIFNDRLNMFGQYCTILLTTQSGAEGISLMNVRQVHIMEPYWNNIRINRVIGRARRIKSHIYLPKDQQIVTTYKYTVRFTKEQLNGNWGNHFDKKYLIKNSDELILDSAEDKSNKLGEKSSLTKTLDSNIEDKSFMSALILKEDDGLTSDEKLNEISHKKTIILNDFLKLIKESAIDCQFNKLENIQSDSDLQNLNCLDVIPTDDDYSFDLSSTFEINNDLQMALEISDKNECIISHKISNLDDSYNVKFLRSVVLLPPEYNCKFIDYLQSHPSLPIYNFYIYYNLDNRTSEYNFKDQIHIGNLTLTDDNVCKIKWLDNIHKINFNKNKKYYLFIENIIYNLQGNSILPSDISKIIPWSINIKKKLDKRIKREKQWTCVICNTKNSILNENCTFIDEMGIKCPYTKQNYIELKKRLNKKKLALKK